MLDRQPNHQVWTLNFTLLDCEVRVQLVNLLLAGWTQAHWGLGSNRSRDAVRLGKLFTPIVPLFTKQRNW